jgi:integrase
MRRASSERVPGHSTPNGLRRSAATLLYEAGVGMEAIADLLGHTSTRMLEQHYRHRTERSLDAHLATTIERLFG